MKSRYIFFGLLFGFVLSRSGASDYDAISGMFRLTDLHLAGVIGAAVGLNALGFWILRRSGAHARNGEAIRLEPKPMARGLAVGALLFGVGWGISGTCPGTALAQIGQGRLAGLVTAAGILLGAWIQQRRATRVKARPEAPRQPVAPAVPEAA